MTASSRPWWWKRRSTGNSPRWPCSTIPPITASPGRDDLLNQIKKQGNKLQVVATEKFNIGDKDMTAQLLRAKNCRCPGDPDLGDRPGTGRRCQRHGQDRHEGAADRRLDALHVQLHRQCREERQRHPDAADLHRGTDHPQGEELHRGVPQGVQGDPHSVAGFRRPGVRRGLHLCRRGETGAEHRHPTRSRKRWRT